MKKYKIGNRIVEAKSVMDAIKINKLVDSCQVKDSFYVIRNQYKDIRICNDINEAKRLQNSEMYKDGDIYEVSSNIDNYKRIESKFGQGDVLDELMSDIRKGKAKLVQDSCKDEASEDTTISALIADEHAAIDAYRVAIENLKGRVSDKAIAVLEHILKEEEEHVKELQSIEEDDEEEVDLNDACKTKDYQPPYAIWVKKSGKWKIWGGTNSTDIDKAEFKAKGYEDVIVVKNGEEPR